MNNFRLSQKKIYGDDRSSIENLHNQKMDVIFKKYDTLDTKKKELLFIKDKIKLLEIQNTKDKSLINTLYTLKENENELDKEIKEIENGHELTDYISKAWDFIEEFKDNTFESKCEPTNNIKNEDNKIDNNNILDYISNKGKTNAGHDYKKYYDKCILNINTPDSNNNKNEIKKCKDCNENDFEIDYSNALIICTNCGLCDK